MFGYYSLTIKKPNGVQEKVIIDQNQYTNIGNGTYFNSITTVNSSSGVYDFTIVAIPLNPFLKFSYDVGDCFYFNGSIYLCTVAGQFQFITNATGVYTVVSSGFEVITFEEIPSKYIFKESKHILCEKVRLCYDKKFECMLCEIEKNPCASICDSPCMAETQELKTLITAVEQLPVIISGDDIQKARDIYNRINQICCCSC